MSLDITAQRQQAAHAGGRYNAATAAANAARYASSGQSATRAARFTDSAPGSPQRDWRARVVSVRSADCYAGERGDLHGERHGIRRTACVLRALAIALR